MDIADRRIATVHFTLTDADSGAPITSTRGHEPLTYMHGTGGIARGLEQALEGRRAGDRVEVVVAPADGFGPRHEALVQTLPRTMWRELSSRERSETDQTTKPRGRGRGGDRGRPRYAHGDGIISGRGAGRADRSARRVPTPDEVRRLG